MNKKIFFNYGTVGLLGEAAYQAAANFLEEYYRVGPPEVLLKYEPYAQELAKEVGLLLNCQPEEVTYIKNTTEGIILASEILPLNPGDEVIVSGNEYPATLLSWLKKKKDGIVLNIIKRDDNRAAFAALLKAIGPKTKAIAISWGQHYDGYLPDLKVLSKLCLKRGIFLIVDGVQGVGTRALDLTKTPVDILVCGGQKYLGGISGIGFMYVNSKIMKQLKDVKVGIRSVKGFDHDGYELKDTAERFQDGTQNLLGIVALHAALKEVNRQGIKQIEKKNLELLKIFKKCLKDNDIPFIDHGLEQCNIISLKIDQPVEFCNYLRTHHIYLKPVKDIARISFSHNSTLEDFKILVAKTREWLDLNFKSKRAIVSEHVSIHRHCGVAKCGEVHVV